MIRLLGLLLGITGAAVALAGAGLLAQEAWQQRQLTQEWTQIHAALPVPVDSQAPTAVSSPAPAGTVQGAAPVTAPAAVPAASQGHRPQIAFAIRVPRLGYYSAVVEGIDVGHLALGPGHYPSTPYPGQPGNVGIAAHNSYWLGFGQLSPGDKVVLETRGGTFTYVVTGTKIVQPTDKTVFAQTTPGNRLTLTTCWPLWAGAFATQRYVIYASEMGGVA